MKTFTELKKAIRNNEIIVFKEDDKYIEIEYIEEITNEFDRLTPILVTYNNGHTEAGVYLSEIYSINE